MAVLLFAAFRFDSVLSGPVCNKALQFPDGNSFSFYAADASSLTLRLLGQTLPQTAGSELDSDGT